MKKGSGRGYMFHKKGRTTVPAYVLAVLLCVGCGVSQDAVSFDRSDSVNMEISGESGGSTYTMGGGSYDYSESYEHRGDDGMPDSSTGAEKPEVTEGRKLITTVNLEVETRQFEEAMASLELRIQEMGGYIENMNTYNGSRYSGSGGSRYADLTVRIPQSGLRDFLTAVSDVSNVVRRSENVEDVTLSYVDMESRRDTLRTEQSRLLAFLDRAETIEEIITIEERLSNVRYELESMESRLRAMDNKVDYATVNLNVSEVKELTPAEEPTLGERIGEGFMGSLRNIRDGATELLVWAVVHLPYFLIWAVFAGIVLLVIWLQRRRSRKRKAQTQGAVPPPVMMPGGQFQNGVPQSGQFGGQFQNGQVNQRQDGEEKK